MKIGIIFDVKHVLLKVMSNRLTDRGNETVWIHWSELVYSTSIAQLNTLDAIYLDRMGETKRSYMTQLNLLGRIGSAKVIVNSPQAYLAARDKAIMYALFRQKKIPMPLTLVLSSMEVLFKTVGNSLSLWIAKSCLGVCAEEVYPFCSSSIPYDLLQKIIDRDGLIVLQEYIKPREPFIWRIDIVAGRIIVANKRYSYQIGSIWQLCNGSRGGKVEFFHPDDVPCFVGNEAIRSVAKLGLEIAGVDLLEADDGRLVVLEVNPEPDITMDRYEFPRAVADYIHDKATNQLCSNRRCENVG